MNLSSKLTSVRRVLLILLLFGVAISSEARAGTFVYDKWESAGISGFLEDWNRSNPGARTVDAVHRSVLLRFPGCAKKIAEQLRKGAQIKNVQVVFPYDGYEVLPKGYDVWEWKNEKWKNNPPRWHLVAWGLRRPWTARKRSLAPTFNAWIQGAGYWKKYGAKDRTMDRYPQRLGPTEVSKKNSKGRMDITPLFKKKQYGETIGKRLRNFEERGILVKKWETYDMRYAGWNAYEWAVCTGGHGLSFKAPHLEVQFASGGTGTVQLPENRRISSVASSVKGTKQGGKPTAVLPDRNTIRQIAGTYGIDQPDWMPDWQWEQVQELSRIGGGDILPMSNRITSGNPRRYREAIRIILSKPPRKWRGWGVHNQLLTYYLYADALPNYVVDHLERYWEAWLYPELPNSELITPHGEKKRKRWKKTKNWRGRSSFYRKRWTQGIGTMNFNHTAIMGALLGGAILDAKHPIQDGRTGLEKLLLRTWNYGEGTCQEMLDDYYYSISLSGQKMISDFGPSKVDRLMGKMIRNRAIELLTSSFHPHVRRVVGPGGRVMMSNVLGYEQEGTYGILHTLTPKGVLFRTNANANAEQHGISLFGNDFPPGRVAVQSVVNEPFLPEWSKHWLEDKPIPYRVTAAETNRGAFTNPPLWRRAYLGHTYALASQDLMQTTVDVTAQWHGGTEPARNADQLGTLTLRYNVGDPHMAKTSGGSMPFSGALASFQQDNRIIVGSKPPHKRKQIKKLSGKGGLKKLYTSIALWTLEQRPGWEIYVKGKRVRRFPVSLKGGQKIVIKDGRTYLGIIPIPSTDLGRKKEVVVKPGKPMTLGQGNDVKIPPALMINSYNLLKKNSMNPSGQQWKKITNKTFGGFVIHMGEKKQHGSFQKFRKMMKQAALTTKWKAGRKTAQLTYKSGGDVMEMGFGVGALKPTQSRPQKWGKNEQAIPYRRFNGENPFPTNNGILRDTTLTQQGTSGKLEKQGAVLTLDRGQMGYLQTEPVSGTYVGFNPFPDLTQFKLSVPGDVTVRADGRIGLVRVSVQPEKNRIRVDQAYKENQVHGNVARHLIVNGLGKNPTVERNGRKLKKIDGGETIKIPLATEKTR